MRCMYIFFGIHVRGLVYGFMWITWGVDNNSMEGRNKTFLHLSVVIHVSPKKVQETLRKCLIVNNNSKSHTRKKKKKIFISISNRLWFLLYVWDVAVTVMSKHYHDVFPSLSSVLAQEMATQNKKRSRAAAICSRNGDFHIFILTEEKKILTPFSSHGRVIIYILWIYLTPFLCAKLFLFFHILWLAHMLSTLLTLFVCVLFDISFITIRWQLEINYAHLSFPIPPAWLPFLIYNRTYVYI